MLAGHPVTVSRLHIAALFVSFFCVLLLCAIGISRGGGGGLVAKWFKPFPASGGEHSTVMSIKIN